MEERKRERKGERKKEEAINLVGCTIDLLHHNKLHESDASLVHLHGNRASSVPRRWGQHKGKGKQKRGGWGREERVESIPSVVSRRGFKQRGSLPSGASHFQTGSELRGAAGERRRGWGGRMHGLQVCLHMGPGSAKVPEPLSGSVAVFRRFPSAR